MTQLHPSTRRRLAAHLNPAALSQTSPSRATRPMAISQALDIVCICPRSGATLLTEASACFERNADDDQHSSNSALPVVQSTAVGENKTVYIGSERPVRSEAQLILRLTLPTKRAYQRIEKRQPHTDLQPVSTTTILPNRNVQKLLSLHLCYYISHFRPYHNIVALLCFSNFWLFCPVHITRILSARFNRLFTTQDCVDSLSP